MAAYEINPSSRDILAVRELLTDEQSGISRLVTSFSLPLALPHSSGAYKELQGVVNTWFENLIDNDLRNRKALEYGDSQIVHDVFEVIFNYYRANQDVGGCSTFFSLYADANLKQNKFLRDMLKLHRLQYLHTIGITLSPACALQTSRNLHRPTQYAYTYDGRLRLINVQVKKIIYVLLRQHYHDVLVNLEKIFRVVSVAAWPLAFCCTIILRNCAEIVQMTADVRTVAAMNSSGSRAAEMARAASINACRKIEEIPIRRVTDIFHDKHHTKRQDTGRGKNKTFNPLRDGISSEKDRKALGPGGVELVNDFRRIIRKHSMFGLQSTACQ